MGREAKMRRIFLRKQGSGNIVQVICVTRLFDSLLNKDVPKVIKVLDSFINICLLIIMCLSKGFGKVQSILVAFLYQPSINQSFASAVHCVGKIIEIITNLPAMHV